MKTSDIRKTSSRPRLDNKTITKALGNYSFILIFLAILATYLIINGGATTWNGVMNILRHSAVVGIIAFGMGIVIITGGIDLSVGSMMALVGGLSVNAYNNTNSIPLTLLCALGAGLLCGLINGVLIGRVKMPAFIVTLSTMMIYRSLAQYYLRSVVGESIYSMNSTLSSYNDFFMFGNQKIMTVPMSGIMLVIIMIFFVFISTCTKYGKSVFAVGSNVKAAKLAGISVERVHISVYAITGLLCGFSAFLWMAMQGSIDPATAGQSYEMYAIAAVVIGGISMSGGKGKLMGIMFGAMSYTIIDKIIASTGFDALINNTIKGCILLIAVFIQIVIPMLRGRAKKD